MTETHARNRGSTRLASIWVHGVDRTYLCRPIRSATPTCPGWLLWVRTGTLVAQRLDVAQGAHRRPGDPGDPVTVDPLYAFVVASEAGAGALSVSATGLVAYRAVAQRQLTWFDRSGKALGTGGTTDGNTLRSRTFPDGRRVVVHRTVQNKRTSGSWTGPT